jgi:spermidine/putrescine-binding protein
MEARLTQLIQLIPDKFRRRSAKHVVRRLIKAGVLLAVCALFVSSMVGCQRVPVEAKGNSASRLDVSEREKEILERIPTSVLDSASSDTASSVLRILARPELIHRESPQKKTLKNSSSSNLCDPERIIAVAEAVTRFTHIYDIRVEICGVTESDLVNGTLPVDLIQGYDLVFVPTHWLSSRDLRKVLAPLGKRKVKGLTKTRESFLSSFTPLPPDMNINYILPFFRTTYGIYFNMATMTSPPESWEDCFLISDQHENWDKVSYLNDPEVTLSIAGLLSHLMEREMKENFLAKVDQVVTEIKDIAGTINATPEKLQSIREEHITDAKLFSNIFDMIDQDLNMHDDGFQPPVSLLKSGNKKLKNDISLDQLTAQDLHFASRLIKYGIIYGAEFRAESLDPVDSELEKWSMTVSHSRDLFGAEDPHEDVHYIVPDEGTMVAVDALAVVKERPTSNLEAVDLFLKFVLEKPVAASLTIFSNRANLVPGSAAYVPAEMVSSPVYTLPPRSHMHFLPHWAPEDVEDEWQKIKEFEAILSSFAAEEIH